MRERRIGVAVIVLLLLVLGMQHAPRVQLSADSAGGRDGLEVRAVVDLGKTAGAVLFTWTIDHLDRR